MPRTLDKAQLEKEAAIQAAFYGSPWSFDYPTDPAVYGQDSIHMDGDEGNGPDVGCLACGTTHQTRYSYTPTYLVIQLYCGFCLEALVHIDTLTEGIHLKGRN